LTPDSLAAKEATAAIPIVALSVADPVGVGLVSSLDRPGGNVTGMLFQPLDFNGQRLALLKEAVPNATRVAVLVNVANPAYVRPLAVTIDAAQRLDLEIQILEVRAADDLPASG
jgi:putative tryptophan/tyrosine transport system substrate-binding protein